MSDRPAVRDGGVLRQVGLPRVVYRSPVDQFAADIDDSPSVNPHSVDREGEIARMPGRITSVFADTELAAGHNRVRVGVRPDDIAVIDSGQNTADVPVGEPGEIGSVPHVQMDHHELTARVGPTIQPVEETRVSFDFRELAVCLFGAHTSDAVSTQTDTDEFTTVETAEH